MKPQIDYNNPVQGPNIAVYGIESLGKIFLRILNRLGSLSSIIIENDTDKESVANYRVPVYSSLKTCLAADKIDGLIINSTKNIVESISQAMTYDIKHFLLIPHNDLSLEILDEIHALSSTNDINIEIGLVENYNPAIRRMWKLIKQGAIGDVRSILIERLSAVPSYSLQQVGDVFHDIGLHDLNLALQFLNSKISLNAHATLQADIPNTATISLRSNEKLMTIRLSREYAGKRRVLEIEGTKATMFIDLLAQTIELNFLGIAIGEKQSIQVSMDEGTLVKTYGEPIEQKIWYFLDSIVNSDWKPKISIIELINTFKMAAAAKRSAKEHKKIELMF